MAVLPLSSARALAPAEAAPRPDLPEGMLVELSGAGASARLSAAVSAVLRAQRLGETTAWIEPAAPAEGGTVYPPDLLDSGVDPAALPVVRVPAGAGSAAPFRAAELLLRSGAFGLVVLDLRGGRGRVPAAWPGRLLACAREHRARVLFLTAKGGGAESMGSLVALRMEPVRQRIRPGLFVVESRVLKNKAGLSLVVDAERRRGPWGLE
jgi:recombination protein RecA